MDNKQVIEKMTKLYKDLDAHRAEETRLDQLVREQSKLLRITRQQIEEAMNEIVNTQRNSK